MILHHPRIVTCLENLKMALVEINPKYENLKLSSEPIEGDKIELRYGISKYDISPEVPNDQLFIRLCSSKIMTNELLRVAGIPHIPLYYSYKIPDRFPVFVRTLTRSFGAKGLIIAKSKEDLNEIKCDYMWSYGIMSVHEYRIHIAFGKVIKTLYKKPKSDEFSVPFIVRNIDNHDYIEAEFKDEFEVIIRKLLSVINMSIRFCAVDILFDEDTRVYRVIELNSAPGLPLDLPKIYAELFIEKGVL